MGAKNFARRRDRRAVNKLRAEIVNGVDESIGGQQWIEATIEEYEAVVEDNDEFYYDDPWEEPDYYEEPDGGLYDDYDEEDY